MPRTSNSAQALPASTSGTARPRDPMGYFPLHVGDWFASETVGLLSRAGEAGYLRLLLHQWKNEDDGLPGDPAKLRVLAGLTPAEWKAAWPILADAFPLNNDDGRRRNPRLVHERAFMLAQREKARTRASKGGAAKAAADAAAKHGSGTGGATPAQRPEAAQAVLKQRASTPEAVPEQCLSMPPHPHPLTTNSESQEAPLEISSECVGGSSARASEPPPLPPLPARAARGTHAPRLTPIGAIVGGLVA